MCIDIQNVCNRQNDCDDESDEQHCSECIMPPLCLGGDSVHLLPAPATIVGHVVENCPITHPEIQNKIITSLLQKAMRWWFSYVLIMHCSYCLIIPAWTLLLPSGPFCALCLIAAVNECVSTADVNKCVLIAAVNECVLTADVNECVLIAAVNECVLTADVNKCVLIADVSECVLPADMHECFHCICEWVCFDCRYEWVCFDCKCEWVFFDCRYECVLIADVNECVFTAVVNECALTGGMNVFWLQMWMSVFYCRYESACFDCRCERVWECPVQPMWARVSRHADQLQVCVQQWVQTDDWPPSLQRWELDFEGWKGAGGWGVGWEVWGGGLLWGVGLLWDGGGGVRGVCLLFDAQRDHGLMVECAATLLLSMISSSYWARLFSFFLKHFFIQVLYLCWESTLHLWK